MLLKLIAQWSVSFQDFISILPAAKGQASAPNNEFIITFKKGKGQLLVFLVM
jgi:hypothetical protein